MRYLLIFMLGIAQLTALSAQDMPAYKLFTSKGKEVKWSKAVRELQDADMVFFGELHDNPIAHWLEFELMKSLYKVHGESLVAGAEMFESNTQFALTGYLSGSIDDKQFQDTVKLWKNYPTDYKPMVDFAREHKIPFIATNVPRKYASMVFKGDFISLDTLNAEEKSLIAPLPIPFDININCYQEMLKMGDTHPEMKIDEKYPKAQAVKDATMAYFIMKNKKSNGLFYHINGSFHSDNFEGIIWYLHQADPGLRIKTITTIEQDDISKPDKVSLGKASYILVVPSSMTKTY